MAVADELIDDSVQRAQMQKGAAEQSREKKEKALFYASLIVCLLRIVVVMDAVLRSEVAIQAGRPYLFRTSDATQGRPPVELNASVVRLLPPLLPPLPSILNPQFPYSFRNRKSQLQAK